MWFKCECEINIENENFYRKSKRWDKIDLIFVKNVPNQKSSLSKW